MNNRERAQECLDQVDAFNTAAADATFVHPSVAAQINYSITTLIARAQVHAILALTDPKDPA